MGRRLGPADCDRRAADDISLRRRPTNHNFTRRIRAEELEMMEFAATHAGARLHPRLDRVAAEQLFEDQRVRDFQDRRRLLPRQVQWLQRRKTHRLIDHQGCQRIDDQLAIGTSQRRIKRQHDPARLGAARDLIRQQLELAVSEPQNVDIMLHIPSKALLGISIRIV